ncbi:MAG: hypothetical protein AAFY71_26550 [Bacteroidota bacterium]
MKNRIPLLVMLAGLFACHQQESNQTRVETLPFFDEATFTPQWNSSQDKQLKFFHRISSC